MSIFLRDRFHLVLDGANLAGFQLLIPFNFILFSLPFILTRGISVDLVFLVFFKKCLIFFVLLEHHCLIFGADCCSFFFVYDVGVSTHSPIVFVSNKFSVKLIVKKVENIEIFIVTIMNYSLFVFIIYVYNDRLFTQNTQFDALFQQAFCSLHISAVSAVIVRDLLHYFIFALAHVFSLLYFLIIKYLWRL